jgi:uncharacterized membrane protein YfcA
MSDLLHTAPWLTPLGALLLAGLLAGFAAGIFGIGGGFVVVPALVIVLPLLGGDKSEYTHVAIATSAATIIITSIRSVTAHAKRGSVEFEVLRTWGPWLVIGSLLGGLLASHINGKVLSIIFGTGVSMMSVLFIYRRLSELVLTDTMPRGLLRVGISGGLGVFSSLLGIGGGAIAITVMTLCGRTIHRGIGTAAGIGTLIAVPSALSYAVFGFGHPGLPWGSVGYVNLPAAVAVSSMSVLTAPLGVAAAHNLPPRLLKPIFGLYLISIGVWTIWKALQT